VICQRGHGNAVLVSSGYPPGRPDAPKAIPGDGGVGGFSNMSEQHYSQFIEHLTDACRRYWQLQKMVGLSNFMRAMELEVTKKFGYSLEQAW